MQMGVDVVFPMHGARDNDFRCGKRLGKKDHLVEWEKPQKPEWMGQETYERFPKRITVREVAVVSGRPGFRSRTRVIVTTFLDSKQVSKFDLEELYNHRWIVEINLRSIKDVMQMGILRGKTPEMVRKEIWAHLLAYNLVRKIIAQSANRYSKKPRELSFKLALQMIYAFRQAGIFCDKSETYYCLLKAIAYKTIGNRPGRIEPRRVKRRPKPFPKLQMARHLYKRWNNAKA